MDFVARKFARSKWEGERIKADAVTGCLRTYQDTLSVWSTDNTEYGIHNIALALASNMDRIDTIHIIAIPKRILLDAGVIFENTPGKIPIKDEDLVGRHQDIVRIDLDVLSTISRIIHSIVNSNENCHRISKKTITGLLCEAVRDGRFELGTLEKRQDSLRREVQKSLDN